LAELRELPGPMEILDLADGETRSFRVTRWERGSTTITPRFPGAQGEKVIEVLRVHVTTDSKPTPPYYYDITSKTLQAQMIPYLSNRGFENLVFTVTKYGVAPRARFTLSVTSA